jgi:cytochrome c oxidase subunit II
MKKLFVILILISLILIIGCSSEPEPTICTQDVQVCPGGLILSREGPNCEFATCPEVAEVPEDEIVVEETNQLTEKKSNVKEFTMKAVQWDFQPSVITVKEGDTVKISITSEDVTHGIRLSEYGISENLKPGKTTTIEFVADKKGTFSFFCSVPCGSGHRQMKGTLIVE